MLTSVDIATKYKKRHADILRTIRDMLAKNLYLEVDFTESYYIDKSNRKSSCYLITDNGLMVMDNKFKYNVRSARFEMKFNNELNDFCRLLNYTLKEQYRINNKYRMDFYLPDFNIGIEYDEKEHKYHTQKDFDRQKEIESVIGCRFIRVSENESVGKALAKITASILQRQVMQLHT